MPESQRKLAVVTGASTGIGLELARECANNDFDLLIAANESELESAADELRREGGRVDTVQVDLATTEGVDQLYEKIGGRPVVALLANAGRGLGHAFLDQDFKDARHVIDTNVTGTVYLVHRVGRDMRLRNEGRIFITGSIADFMPGSYQAVYNGTKAFLDSFSYALREELKETNVTVTCLMPGATETEFFRRADMLDTKVGTAKKDDAGKVAKDGFKAMMAGEGGVVSGWQNKLEAAAAHVMPAERLAKKHTEMAAPGTAKIGETALSFLSAREDAAHPWAQPPFDRCRNKRKRRGVGISNRRSPLPTEPRFCRCSSPDSAPQARVHARRHGPP
jgi:short-subunit dehydrogenase